ncbi:MAG: ribosomal RNA small subunit methyltransferase A, partial [Candidatus Portnoybacteria bacterium CG_4_10_14_0_2_um_filter_39_11]
MGQNFLINKRAIKELIKAADLKKNDVVLEIGPGIGVLTMELAKKVKKVIAIEKDPRMCEILGELLECWNVRNVELVEGDILKLDPKPYTLKPYKVVANLPFYLTAPVIRKFLETIEPSPQQMVLVAQKEVGQRICAKPPEMSILAVSVQFYVHPVKSSRSEFNRAGPEIISYVSRKSFWPSPKVDSAIIRITPRQPAPYRNEVSGAGFRERFFEIVKAGFSHPRKQ